MPVREPDRPEAEPRVGEAVASPLVGPEADAGADPGDVRERDRAAIARLSDDLLPALIAKLGATGLGELEVREADWRVRLRMPADRSTERRPPHARPQAHGHPSEGRTERIEPAGLPTAARGHPGAGPDPADLSSHVRPEPGTPHASRTVARSPAVGFFEARRDLTSGSRVQEGDRLGTVDVLGIRQDVLAPVDGVLGSLLAEPGDAVEYGQELVAIEASRPDPGTPGGTDGETPVAVGPGRESEH